MDMRKLLFALALIFVSSAHADFCEHARQQVNGISRHIGSDNKINEWNPGVGVVCQTSSSMSSFIGFYKNSFNNDSYYAGSEKHLRYGDGDLHLDPGVVVLAATGYQESNQVFSSHGISALMYLNLAISYKDSVKLNIGYGPARLFDRDGIDVVIVNFEIGS
jgi:hypothetical protein